MPTADTSAGQHTRQVNGSVLVNVGVANPGNAAKVSGGSASASTFSSVNTFTPQSIIITDPCGSIELSSFTKSLGTNIYEAVTSLTIETCQTLVIPEGVTLNVPAPFIITNKTSITNNGTFDVNILTNSYGSNFTNTGTLNINKTLSNYEETTFNNTGTININQGSDVSLYSTFNNNGTLVTNLDSRIDSIKEKFNNNGLLRMNRGSAFVIQTGVEFINNGIITIQNVAYLSLLGIDEITTKFTNNQSGSIINEGVFAISQGRCIVTNYGEIKTIEPTSLDTRFQFPQTPNFMDNFSETSEIINNGKILHAIQEWVLTRGSFVNNARIDVAGNFYIRDQVSFTNTQNGVINVFNGGSLNTVYDTINVFTNDGIVNIADTTGGCGTGTYPQSSSFEGSGSVVPGPCPESVLILLPEIATFSGVTTDESTNLTVHTWVMNKNVTILANEILKFTDDVEHGVLLLYKLQINDGYKLTNYGKLQTVTLSEIYVSNGSFVNKSSGNVNVTRFIHSINPYPTTQEFINEGTTSDFLNEGTIEILPIIEGLVESLNINFNEIGEVSRLDFSYNSSYNPVTQFPVSLRNNGRIVAKGKTTINFGVVFFNYGTIIFSGEIMYTLNLNSNSYFGFGNTENGLIIISGENATLQYAGVNAIINEGDIYVSNGGTLSGPSNGIENYGVVNIADGNGSCTAGTSSSSVSGTLGTLCGTDPCETTLSEIATLGDENVYTLNDNLVITNCKTLVIPSEVTLIIPSGLTIDNRLKVTINQFGKIILESGALFINRGTTEVLGELIFNSSNSTFNNINGGTLLIRSGLDVTFGGLINNYGTINNYTQLYITFKLNNDNKFYNYGIVEFSNSEAINTTKGIFEVYEDGEVNIKSGSFSNQGLISNNGLFNLSVLEGSSGNVTLTNGNRIDNKGTITFAKGSRITNNGTVNNYNTIHNGTFNSPGNDRSSIFNNYGKFYNIGNLAEFYNNESSIFFNFTNSIFDLGVGSKFFNIANRTVNDLPISFLERYISSANIDSSQFNGFTIFYNIIANVLINGSFINRSLFYSTTLHSVFPDVILNGTLTNEGMFFVGGLEVYITNTSSTSTINNSGKFINCCDQIRSTATINNSGMFINRGDFTNLGIFNNTGIISNEVVPFLGNSIDFIDNVNNGYVTKNGRWFSLRLQYSYGAGVDINEVYRIAIFTNAFTINNRFLNNGTFTTTGNFQNNGNFTNNDKIVFSRKFFNVGTLINNSSLTINNNCLVNNIGTITNGNNGVFTHKGQSTSNDGRFENKGVLNLDTGFTNKSTFINEGIVKSVVNFDLSSGTCTNTSTGIIYIYNGGNIKYSRSTLINNGTLNISIVGDCCSRGNNLSTSIAFSGNGKIGNLCPFTISNCPTDGPQLSSPINELLSGFQLSTVTEGDGITYYDVSSNFTIPVNKVYVIPSNIGLRINKPNNTGVVFTVNGSLINNGVIKVFPGGSFIINTTGLLDNRNNFTLLLGNIGYPFINNGTVANSGLLETTNSAITNSSTGILTNTGSIIMGDSILSAFDASTNSGIINNSSSIQIIGNIRINNSGTLNNASTGYMTTNCRFYNTGTLTNSGTITNSVEEWRNEPNGIIIGNGGVISFSTQSSLIIGINSTMTINSGCVLTISLGSTLTLQATITNNGTIWNFGVTNHFGNNFVGSIINNSTITNFGILNILSQVDNYNTIINEGGTLNIKNSGVISSSGPITNKANSAINVIDAGVLSINDTSTLTNFGTLNVTNRLTITSNAFLINSGAITNIDTLTFDGTVTNSGTITNSHILTIGSTLTNSGTITNLNRLTINGTLTNSGTITNSDILTIEGTLTNTGTITNSDTLTINGTLTSSGTITNSDTLTIEGTLTNTGTLNNNFTIQNNGTVNNNTSNGRIINNRSFINNTSQIFNSGTFENKTSNGLVDYELNGVGSTFTNSGTLTISGSNSNFYTRNSVTTFTDTSILNITNGTFHVNSTVSIFSFTSTNQGILINNATINFNSPFTQNGIITNNGTMNINDSLTNTSQATLINKGTLEFLASGTVTNSGLIENASNNIYIRKLVTNNGTISNSTITGDASINIMSTGTVINNNNIQNNIGRFIVGGLTTYGGSLINNSNGEITNNGYIECNYNGGITNNGTIKNYFTLIIFGALTNNNLIENNGVTRSTDCRIDIYGRFINEIGSSFSNIRSSKLYLFKLSLTLLDTIGTLINKSITTFNSSSQVINENGHIKNEGIIEFNGMEVNNAALIENFEGATMRFKTNIFNDKFIYNYGEVHITDTIVDLKRGNKPQASFENQATGKIFVYNGGTIKYYYNQEFDTTYFYNRGNIDVLLVRKNICFTRGYYGENTTNNGYDDDYGTGTFSNNGPPNCETQLVVDGELMKARTGRPSYIDQSTLDDESRYADPGYGPDGGVPVFGPPLNRFTKICLANEYITFYANTTVNYYYSTPSSFTTVYFNKLQTYRDGILVIEGVFVNNVTIIINSGGGLLLRPNAMLINNGVINNSGMIKIETDGVLISNSASTINFNVSGSNSNTQPNGILRNQGGTVDIKPGSNSINYNTSIREITVPILF